MSPNEVRDYLDRIGAAFGQNVTLPDDVDTSSCSQFWGTRCPENVHVTGKNMAHIDRVDPRSDLLGHLKHDVGIPYTLIGTVGCAALGAAAFSNNRTQGAKVSAALGFLGGLIADIVSYYNSNKNNKFDESL